MNLKELFEKIYNGEITENDVIVELEKDCEEEYKNYILNDGFDFWKNTGDGVLSLFFLKSDNYTGNYKTTYSIIPKEQFEIEINKIEKEEEIKLLEEKLRKLRED